MDKRASFGIALGAIGSDAQIETADIALMTDDLDKPPWLVRHSQHTLVFALSVKAAFVVLTFAGDATLWGAIAADVGASLLVVANGLPLLRPSNGSGVRALHHATEHGAGAMVIEKLTHGHRGLPMPGHCTGNAEPTKFKMDKTQNARVKQWHAANTDRSRYWLRPLWPVALGILVGFADAQTLPVADTFARALIKAGLSAVTSGDPQELANRVGR